MEECSDKNESRSDRPESCQQPPPSERSRASESGVTTMEGKFFSRLEMNRLDSASILSSKQFDDPFKL